MKRVDQYIAYSLLIIFLAFFAYWLNFKCARISTDTEDWGNFGSYIGGIAGAFLSFISIVLLIVTLKEQSKENHKIQFESMFFELFRLQKEVSSRIVGSVKNIDDKSTDYAGEQYFIALGKRISYEKDFKEVFSNFLNQVDITKIEAEELKEKIQIDYDKIYSGRESELGHYFRSLYHLLKFIHESTINDKERYMDLVQAYLTDSELYVIFYNGIGRYGFDNFRPLLDDYSFLENIKTRGQQFEHIFKTFYPKTFMKFEAKPKSTIPPFNPDAITPHPRN